MDNDLIDEAAFKGHYGKVVTFNRNSNWVYSTRLTHLPTYDIRARCRDISKNNKCGMEETQYHPAPVAAC